MKLRRFLAEYPFIYSFVIISFRYLLFIKLMVKHCYYFAAGDRGRLWVFAAASDWFVVFDPISFDVTPSHAAERD